MRIALALSISMTLATACASPPDEANDHSATTVDLARAFEEGRLSPVARTITVFSDGERRAVAADSVDATGLVWLDGVEFETGTLEFEVRGRDVQGASFVGLAFGGVNDSTYEAVYLRPFNFQARDSTRHTHGIQYIKHPEFPWYVLREEQSGEFEHAVDPAPDPDAWHVVRLDVLSDSVRAYVREGAARGGRSAQAAGWKAPDLAIKRLAPSRVGKVGLWIGYGSPGEFSWVSVNPVGES